LADPIGLGVDRSHIDDPSLEIEVRRAQCEQFIPAQSGIGSNDQNRSEVFAGM
jgi:hypothetical protein